MLKRTFLYLLASGLILTSCSKIEVVKQSDYEDYINITPNTSRGAVNAISNIKNGVSVFATTTEDVYIENGKYRFTDGAWGWEGAPYAWPKTGYPITFYAMYPYENIDDWKGITKTVTVNQASVNQIDYMAGVSETIAKRPMTGKIYMNFVRIMSKIDISVQVNVGMTAHVVQAGVNSVMQTGRFNYKSLVWDQLQNRTNFSYYDPNVQPVKIFTSASPELFFSLPNSHHLMLLPQANVPFTKNETSFDHATGDVIGGNNGAYVSMVYRLSKGDEDLLGHDLRADVTAETEWELSAPEYDKYKKIGGTYAGALFLKVGFPIDDLWERGKDYSYNLLLGANTSTNGLYMSKYYYDEDGNNTKIPVEYSGVESGAPVSSGKINIDVSVDDWDDTTNSN